MTGRGPGPTVPPTPRPPTPTDADAQSQAAVRAVDGVDDQAAGAGADTPSAEASAAGAGADAGAGAAVSAPAASPPSAPTAHAGPPDDATTTFEDLPGDLFGEPEPPHESAPEPAHEPASEPTPGPAPRRSDASSSSTEPRSSAPREESRRSSPPPGRTNTGDAEPRDAVGPRANETSAGDELAADRAIDMVQTFFPGRIVALEAAAEELDDEASEDETATTRPGADADGGPHDGATRRSG